MIKGYQPFVCVVTPLYNTEKYLKECIESVLHQTYSNWEYIILNNRSTDRSLEIAESYARKDSRIRVINNEKHLKQMENLNRAFHYMSEDSKYCKVIHADDWLFPECLFKMVEVAESYPSVGIVGSYRLDEREVNLDGLPFPSPCTDGRAIARDFFLSGRYFFGSPSSLLIRSDLIRKRKPFYDESTLHGDTIACLDILREADFGFVHQVLTFTRRHNESATSYIRKYETYRLSRLQPLILYGKYFLSPEEYTKCLKLRLDNYHHFLAAMVIELKGFEFFRFHKKELMKLGQRLSNLKLAFAVIWEFLNFRDSVRKLVRASRRDELRKAFQPNAVNAGER
jgi:glycosyltransferase involved in cell wall biosynthesis